MTQPKETQPPQHQSPPGRESEMTPKPKSTDSQYRGSGKLQGKAALITGGDSGIGRAVAAFYAKEGADVAIVYREEREDAEKTGEMVEAEGKKCVMTQGDIGNEQFCQQAVGELGHLDILINNAGEQHPQSTIEDISAEQLERTFRTNIFGMFFMTKAALPHLKEGSAIVNTTSVTAYQGSPQLLDYSATKGAIVAFPRSLSQSLVEKGI
jgi:NAD(P)-dependent dehydrogenase (short-subunit alcohol dehydrogenase family)